MEQKLAHSKLQFFATAFDPTASSFDSIKLRRLKRDSSESVLVPKQQREEQEEQKLFTALKFVQTEIPDEFQPITFDARFHDHFTFFFDFSEENVESLFDHVLSNFPQYANTKLSFHTRPGKIVFRKIKNKQTNRILEKKNLVTQNYYLSNKHGLIPEFAPILNPDYFTHEGHLMKQFEMLEFEEVSDLYPKRDMLVTFARLREKRATMSVEIAENHQAAEIKEKKKSELISAILSAETLGDVLDNVDKKDVKMTHFKKKKLLKSGDKTSNQTRDALQILDDAYNRMTHEASPTESALKIESTAECAPNNAAQEPVKVLKQLGFLNISELSAAPLEWRASLVLKERQVLPEGIQEVLNRCSEDSSSSSSNKLPYGTEDWRVCCIKRILETKYWVKEIESDDSDQGCTALLRVKVIATIFKKFIKNI